MSLCLEHIIHSTCQPWLLNGNTRFLCIIFARIQMYNECFSSQLGIVVHRMFDIVYTNMPGFTKKEIIFSFGQIM